MPEYFLLACALACPLAMVAMMLLMRGRKQRRKDE